LLLTFVWELDESPEVVGYEIRIGTTAATWDTIEFDFEVFTGADPGTLGPFTG
jgi:hypothetical protein